jgi:putative molybdopterin biosynthesis protein
MRLVPTLAWTLEAERDEALDARLLPLLDAVRSGGSLAAAVAGCGISYRAAWGLLRDYEATLGAPLVRLERGRGATVTALGAKLLDAHTSAHERLARALAGLAVELRAEAAPPIAERMQRLRVAASHDLALAALVESFAAGRGIALDVAVMGSLNALREFADGRADAAGFHVPLDRAAPGDREPFLRLLDARRDKLVRLVDRDQGLIVARGNPRRVRTLRDVAERGLRFVNRQRGSGTRLLIDRMLAEQRIEPSRLEGFANEEFTHAAVAATVASGGADAGFGLRAAAAEYGLAFVPLVRERYFLAALAKEITKSPLARLIEVLKAAEFARVVRRLPGYHAAGAGSVIDVAALRQ